MEKTIEKWKHIIDENVRSGLVELLILNMLQERDMYGYEIRQELDKRTNGAFLVKEGSLYGPLYRLCQRKLMSDHIEPGSGKRFRNYYHLEESGREYLKYGLEQIEIVFAGVSHLLEYNKNHQLKEG